ncbi:rhodanese-like domain-containing protein [Sporosarcina ureae]|uniref:rhodanese-like domain-containing protein n=1 Tax=Sporosarcina ureae TaxID=1571 RepID=UPI0009DC4F72|nr:rhodanese-like domain-containing protein [Sporosarcina ureae]ARF16449.1 hypothetical protein SporoP17a_03460 [Sporosarcina ureae]
MKKLVWLITLVLVLTACGSTDKVNEGFPTVDLEDVEALQKEGAVVMDVREVDEYNEGHIRSAINLPLSQLQDGERAGLDQEQKYIVICRSGSRSQTASEILHKEGYDVTNVSEGMSTWRGPVE